ncbi:MAG TPA: alpha/beta fold hydrolase [Solirubrobacteraceae bacterium]|nr:alpha/beta fold hydrolase [Solirubrobacteraceae bacterium]
MGHLVPIGDTALHVEERGDGPLAVIALHGGPGLDHTEFGWWLDPLAEEHRLVLVDGRAQGRSAPASPETWTIARFARDVDALAAALGLGRFVVLGHSFGAFVALQHLVDAPGTAAGTVVSCGVPALRWLDGVAGELERFEPADLRDRVRASWAREADARTPQDVAALLADQLPFHFADPRDPRIGDLRAAMATAVYAPDVLRAAATGAIADLDVEERLPAVREPVLVLAGAHDRVCPPAASEAIAAAIPGAALHVFADSAHMPFVEQPGEYVDVLTEFLGTLG